MSEHRSHLRAVHRRHGTGWLAVIALLLNLLLPTALFLGAPDTPTTAIGFCGAAHGGVAPGGSGLPVGRPHCVFCLVAGVAPAPAPPARLATPRFIGLAVAPALPLCLTPRRLTFAVAQPRGPPASA